MYAFICLFLKQIFTETSIALTVKFLQNKSTLFNEGPEGLKYELGFAYVNTGKVGFDAQDVATATGKKKQRIMGMGKMSYRVYRSFETLVKSLYAYNCNKQAGLLSHSKQFFLKKCN